MNIHVLVNNEDQLAAALNCEAVSEIYVEADAFEKSVIARCHTKNKKCVIALPYIYRDVTYIDTDGYDGVLIRSLDELAAYRGDTPAASSAAQRDCYMISDYGLYAMNEYAAGFIADHGVKRITLPQELNEHELKDLVSRITDMKSAARTGDDAVTGDYETGSTACRCDMPETEMIIYGYIPMMVSAQCVKKNTQANAGAAHAGHGCDRVPGIRHFTDRKGNRLPVENKCAYCYNLIYNPMPMSLFGIMDKAANVGADSYRINFTIEDKDEAVRVLDLFTGPAAFANLHSSAGMETFTRGHFTRGVE